MINLKVSQSAIAKIAEYLQEHIAGEVTIGADVRNYFATDASILRQVPQMVVYPRGENDIRKLLRFSWQLAEKGRIVPIIARGSGSDVSGAAIGNGIIIALKAHMDKILFFDGKHGTVTVQPGLIIGRLQQVMTTYGYFLPAYPASANYATIGGAIGNNASGETNCKYGKTGDYVNSIRVVLANGDVIDTERVSKKELNKLKGKTDFESDVYRKLDSLINDNWSLIEANQDKLRSCGYDLYSVKQKDGSFDLSTMLIGSQGTLGVIIEANLTVKAHDNDITTIMIKVDEWAQYPDVLKIVRSSKPMTAQFYDSNMCTMVEESNPGQLRGLVAKPYPAVTLILDFDQTRGDHRSKHIKKLRKAIDELGLEVRVIEDEIERESFKKLVDANATIFAKNQGLAKALPVCDDVSINPELLGDFIAKASELITKSRYPLAFWGRVLDGVVRFMPVVDLSQVTERQRLLRFIGEYCQLVCDFGGSISTNHGIGRIRAPHLDQFISTEVKELLVATKAIFDPFGILNTDVITGTDTKAVTAMVRHEYTLGSFYDYLPHS